MALAVSLQRIVPHDAVSVGSIWRVEEPNDFDEVVCHIIALAGRSYKHPDGVIGMVSMLVELLHEFPFIHPSAALLDIPHPRDINPHLKRQLDVEPIFANAIKDEVVG